MKAIIGVMPLWDDEKDSIWMLPGYMDGIREAGGLPIIFPFTKDKEELEQLVQMCDGLLFTGGHDVSPDLYHEKALDGLVVSCQKRDEMESLVLQIAIDTNKPLLGICRGIQFVNAALGGTLYQDIPTQHPSDIEHHQSAPYDIPAHEVKILPETPLYSLVGKESLAVNSYHHQAVKDVAEGLEVMALSTDGLVEALYMPSHPFLWAVQWHPEFSYQKDEVSKKILRAFVESVAKGRVS
ncbi:MAG: gamma-glutamyl-gamma-aminobutyrate hydrolase family protein [Lachnospiraceae bacterium]|nr:gamma-glutamyl-gamma-aminobutyrate hydrolase family protein [Lachnospiraceae bacterium]